MIWGIVDIAEALGISAGTAHCWLRQGRIPRAQRVGSRWYVGKRDLDIWRAAGGPGRDASDSPDLQVAEYVAALRLHEATNGEIRAACIDAARALGFGKLVTGPFIASVAELVPMCAYRRAGR